MNLIDSASLVVTPNGYKTSKLYSIVPTDGTGDMTFARTGDTATRVNPSGLIESVTANKPRLDYLGGGCPKLLIEPQRTNLALYSEQFDNAAWTTYASNATVTGNTTIAPDGNSTADSILVSATANILHYIQQRPGVSLNATTYTMSCFVKKLGYDYCRLQLSDAGTGIAVFRFSTKTITLSGANVVANSGRVEELANGWFRISFSILTTSAGSWRWWIIPLNDAGQDVFTGDITKGLYAWGFQVEQGTYATSYISTSTASVTRNADSCEKTSATALIGQTEGTMFVNLERLISNVSSGTVPIALQISDGTINNRIFIGQVTSANKFYFYVIVGGTAQLTLQTIDFNLGRSKIAVGYKSNDFVIYVNGVQVYTSSSISIPTCSKISIGGIGASTEVVHPISSVALWKTKLQNSELATLTAL
jgi:hypothetical protein